MHAQCFPQFERYPFLLEEEETYEPPEDPDSGTPLAAPPPRLRFSLPILTHNAPGLSLEELGMRALARLPRDKALDGIRAFNSMRCVTHSSLRLCCVLTCLSHRTRDDLMAYLRPFAQEGRVVGDADISAFFEARRAG
jgi:E3 ubiquitin-protein ligase UBR7